MTEAERMPEWRQYWTPEEYAEMQELLTPEKLAEEMVRMRAKMEHYRRVQALGFSVEEAALLRAASIAMAAAEERVE